MPLFIISIHYDRYGLALAILIVAGLTDGLDGILARSLNQKTALGAYLDPIADKLLLSSSFVILALNRKISWWLATLVLSRDIILLTAAAVILVVVGLPAISAEYLRQSHDGAADSAGIHGGAAGGNKLELATGDERHRRLSGGRLHSLLRLPLLLHGGPPPERAAAPVAQASAWLRFGTDQKRRQLSLSCAPRSANNSRS